MVSSVKRQDPQNYFPSFWEETNNSGEHTEASDPDEYAAAYEVECYEDVGVQPQDMIGVKSESHQFWSKNVLTNIVLMLSPKQIIESKLLVTSTRMRSAVFEVQNLLWKKYQAKWTPGQIFCQSLDTKYITQSLSQFCIMESWVRLVEQAPNDVLYSALCLFPNTQHNVLKLNYAMRYFQHCDIMVSRQLQQTLKYGKDKPYLLNDVKQRVRLVFEHLKSLSTFKWKKNEDLERTFVNHHDHCKKLLSKLNPFDASAANQLYIVMIKFILACGDIMLQQPVWKSQSSLLEDGRWHQGYKELVFMHRFTRLPAKQTSYMTK